MKDLFNLLRRNWLFFLLTTIAALALRLFFVFKFPHLSGDSFIYGDIAKNLLNHGIYGVHDNSLVRPTLMRLPGYPAFLAAIFAIFGQEHYRAVMVVQALIDTNLCLVISALALELVGTKAAKIAYLLAALCPFTAMYSAAVLAETLAIFCTAHALYYGVRGLKALRSATSGLELWFFAGFWTAIAILLRPDGAILLVPFAAALLGLLFMNTDRPKVVTAGVLYAIVALAPLVPWTIRNWRTFHMFQPLAPRYANDPGEFVPHGFNHWVKTWMVDTVSVEEIYWSVPGEPLEFQLLPERAFDSRLEYDATQGMADDYNKDLFLTPQLDGQFDHMARERVAHNPFRYYVWLPALRIADMWLRPRTELLPIESRWWEFEAHEGETVFAVAWALLNLFYLVAAWRGFVEWRLGIYGAVLIGFVVLRSIFLGTLENPEPRYVLECYPVVLVFAAGAFVRRGASPWNT